MPQKVVAQHMRREDNIFVISAKSAWLSASVLCRRLRLVQVALREVHDKCWILLSMDVCPVHLSPHVALAAKNAGFCLHYIPASMTSTLQPLDTHVFAHFKLRLSQAHHDLLVQSKTGTVSLETFFVGSTLLHHPPSLRSCLAPCTPPLRFQRGAEWRWPQCLTL